MSTRVAAIGVCHWHSIYDAAYLRHLSEMEDVEIVGIQDDDKSIAEHRATETAPGCPTFEDYRAMLREVEPDFVLALGRHDDMAETAHHLLDEGVLFIMEKPMSFSARELRGVVEKAEAVGGFAAVPLSNRYLPFTTTAKALAASGAYGPITHFYYRMNRPTSGRYPAWGSGWMLDPKVSNGGCLRNLGSHGLDVFVHLTGEGEEVEVTGAQLSWSTHGQPVEDYASVLVRSANGVLGTVEVGNVFPWDGTDGEWKVAFRDAVLTLKDDVLRLHTREGEVEPPAVVDTLADSGERYARLMDSETPARYDAGGGGALADNSARVLRETIDAAAAGGRPPVSVVDCYRAVRLIDAAYLAAGNPYGTAAL